MLLTRLTHPRALTRSRAPTHPQALTRSRRWTPPAPAAGGSSSGSARVASPPATAAIRNRLQPRGGPMAKATTKKRKPQKEPNYLIKLRYLQRIGALPSSAGLHEIAVAHDGWCAYFKGGRCNCDPHLT